MKDASHTQLTLDFCLQNWCIQQGDSTIEVLIWMINQYIPVLKQASRLKDNDKDDKYNKCAGDIKN
ncbi:MAG: hypothetical protein KME46_03975 [Brasilonema angustatum HA4187-MV1]|nr:hypothetical protein [Brasilonema angustatum HA4187-MV1]